MFVDWFDTVDRQGRGTETSGHWLDAVDRQRVCSEMLRHWFVTIFRQRRFWSLVTGQTH